jgi:hypothetical protein
MLVFYPGDFISIQDIFIFFDGNVRLENFSTAISSSFLYRFLILNSTFSDVLGEVLVDKTFIQNSGVLKLKSEVISNLFYDIHFIVSGLEESSTIDLSSVFIKLLIKPFYLLI